MKYVYILAGIIAAVVCFVCCNPCKEELWVYYLNPNSERTCAYTPEELYQNIHNKACKNVYINGDDYRFIINNIKKTTYKKRVIMEPCMVVKTNKLTFFIDEYFGAYDINKDSVSINSKTIYMIKVYAEYYNKIPRNDLKYKREIVLYGIPKNYHYNQLGLKDILNKKHLNTAYRIKAK